MKQLKRCAALVLALCMACMLFGCAQEEQAKTLSVCAALVGAPATLDPAMATSESERALCTHLYENLMKLNASGTVCAQAASYTYTDNMDGTETYAFRLRGDIYWSDGRAVTALDFVYAWQRLVDPETNSPYAEVLSVVAGYEDAREGDLEALQVTAVDGLTLEVTLNCHCPYFLSDICTSVYTMPVRSDAVLASPTSWAASETTLLTNGAYSVRSWSSNKLVAVETESYYDAKRLGPEKLEFIFSTTTAGAAAMFDSGAVDFVVGGKELNANEAAVSSGYPQTGILLINQMATTLNESTRQALSLSIDRNALAQTLGGDYIPAEGLIPQSVHISDGTLFRSANGPLIDNEPDNYAAACQQAQELVYQVGYGGVGAAERLGVITLLYENNQLSPRIAVQLQQMWHDKLGITVTLKGVSAEEMAQALQSGEFTLALMSVRGNCGDAADYLERYASENKENYGQYYSNAYDMLLRAAENAGISEARDAYLEDAESLLLESGYVIPLFSVQRYWAISETLTGVISDNVGICHLTGVVETVAQ